MAASSAKNYCEYCNIHFPTLFESLKHEGNMDHCLKKLLSTIGNEGNVTQSRSSSPDSSNDPNDMSCNLDDSLKHNYATYDGDNVFTCKICSTFVTGYIPFQQHVLGSKHQKKLKNFNEATKLREMQDMFKGLEISEIIDDESNQMQLVSSRNSPGNPKLASGNAKLAAKNENTSVDVTFPFACESCDMKFTGEEPFMQHLDSGRHLKKVQKLVRHVEIPAQQAVSVQNGVPSTTPDPKSEEITMNGTDLSFPYVCSPCAKRFTGEEPYRQHLDSAVHLKKSSVAALGAGDQIFSCGDCQLTFSGPIPLKQHLESPKHEKQMRKIEMFGRMSTPSPKTRTQTSFCEHDGESSKLERELRLWQHLSATNRSGSGSYRPGDIACIGVDEPVTLL